MTLSSRAKAFCVDNLLQSPSSSSSSTYSSEASIPERIEICDGASGGLQRELTREVVSPCRSVPETPLQSETSDEVFTENVLSTHTINPCESTEDPVTSCFCHGEMSFCMHPGIINVADYHGSGTTVSAELLHSDLWFKFHRLGTEMIITKSGRRMFPSLKLRINGLDPRKAYETRLEFLQPDCKKYRYIYHSSRWMVSGSGDALASTPSHISPECPMTGQAICSQVLSFERLKLTNSENSKPGQVSLVSMQKFQPQVVIQEVGGNDMDQKTLECYQIVFAQTSFMAVTAYQNQQITTLKIASNPFAKGFRDSGKLRYPYEGKTFSHHHNSGVHDIRLAYEATRGFPPFGHPMLEAMETRLGRKRTLMHPFELDTDETGPKAMRFDIFNAPPPLPLILHPHLGLSPYLAPGYPQSPPEHTIQPNIFRHDLSSLQQNALISRNNDLPITRSLSSFSSPPSSLSSSSSLTSPSFSQLTTRDNQTSPTFLQSHNVYIDDTAPLRHSSSTSSLNSTMSTPKSNCDYSERATQIPQIKQELECNTKIPCHSEPQIDNSPQLQKKETIDKPIHQIHYENLNESTQPTPLMPINNFVDNQHDTISHTKSNSRTIPTQHQSCKNCTMCLNESMKLIPYLYRHPLFGMHHGQYQTGHVFTHP